MLAHPGVAAIAIALAGFATIGWAANEWWQAWDEMKKAEQEGRDVITRGVDALQGDFQGGINAIRKELERLGITFDDNQKYWVDWQQQANDAFSKVVEAGESMGKDLQPIPELILEAWESQLPYFRDAAKMGMKEYITELKVQAGYSREEAEKAAQQVVNALGSEDEAAREAGERMMQELLMSLVAQGEITLTEARLIAGQIAGALEVKPQVGESMSQWARDMITLFGGVQSAANNAAGAINNATGTHTEGVGGTHTQMQHGGLVTRPTLALIGEAGPELVVPLTGPNAGRGMSTITFNGDIYLPGIKDSHEFEAWATRQAQESKMLGAVYG